MELWGPYKCPKINRWGTTPIGKWNYNPTLNWFLGPTCFLPFLVSKLAPNWWVEKSDVLLVMFPGWNSSLFCCAISVWDHVSLKPVRSLNPAILSCNVLARPQIPSKLGILINMTQIGKNVPFSAMKPFTFPKNGGVKKHFFENLSWNVSWSFWSSFLLRSFCWGPKDFWFLPTKMGGQRQSPNVAGRLRRCQKVGAVGLWPASTWGQRRVLRWDKPLKSIRSSSISWSFFFQRFEVCHGKPKGEWETSPRKKISLLS